MLGTSTCRGRKDQVKQALLAALALGLISTSWAQGLQASAQACAYKVDELESTLGIKLEAGRGTEIGFAGGKTLSCTYPGKGLHSVALTLTRMDNAAALTSGYERFQAGTMEPIAGDADKARWQLSQGDLTDVTLHYLRGNTQSQVRVRGVNAKNKSDVEAMRARVLKLRRLS